jgi:hypothetical protein
MSRLLRYGHAFPFRLAHSVPRPMRCLDPSNFVEVQSESYAGSGTTHTAVPSVLHDFLAADDIYKYRVSVPTVPRLHSMSEGPLAIPFVF